MSTVYHLARQKHWSKRRRAALMALFLSVSGAAQAQTSTFHSEPIQLFTTPCQRLGLQALPQSPQILEQALHQNSALQPADTSRLGRMCRRYFEARWRVMDLYRCAEVPAEQGRLPLTLHDLHQQAAQAEAALSEVARWAQRQHWSAVHVWLNLSLTEARRLQAIWDVALARQLGELDIHALTPADQTQIMEWQRDLLRAHSQSPEAGAAILSRLMRASHNSKAIRALAGEIALHAMPLEPTLTRQWLHSPWLITQLKNLYRMAPERLMAASEAMQVLTPQLSLNDQRLHIRTLMAHHLSEEALIAIDGLLSQTLEPALACELRFHKGHALRKLRRYDVSEQALSEAMKHCEGVSQETYQRAWFLLGQVRIIAQPWLKAQETLQDFATQNPENSRADDALFLAAATAQSAGYAAQGRALFEQIIHDMAAGDMCQEARFRLGYQAYAAQDWPHALQWLRPAQTLCRTPPSASQRDQFDYFLARTLIRSGQADDSLLSQIYQRAPLSYYGQMAYAQMHHPLSAHACTNLQKPLPELEKQLWDTLNQPALQEAKQLIEFGMLNEAAQHLTTQWSHRPRSPEERYWLLRLGNVLTRESSSTSTHDPKLAAYLQYPTIFTSQLADIETEEGIGSDLLLALIREESAFIPTASSWANAYGYTQMTLPTAVQTAQDKGLGVTPTKQMLMMRPFLSITLGAHHLKMLQQQFTAVPLMLAAYNAGPQATQKWMAARAHKPLDEFIEEIPIRETKDYVKRILSSRAHYQCLYQGRVTKIDPSPLSEQIEPRP